MLYLLSHFVAVTSWVMAFQRFPGVPREMRTAFYGGLATWLMIANLAVVAIVYSLAANLPPPLSAALLLLTPMYFLTSLWGSAREGQGSSPWCSASCSGLSSMSSCRASTCRRRG